MGDDRMALVIVVKIGTRYGGLAYNLKYGSLVGGVVSKRRNEPKERGYGK